MSEGTEGLQMDKFGKADAIGYAAFGAIVIFCLLAFVNEFSVLGQRCYYVGSFSPDSCFAPWIYYLGWVIGVAPLSGGIVMLLRAR